MQAEDMSGLLQKLSEKQYSLAMHDLSKNNPKIRVSGFTTISKIPVKYAAATAKTHAPFREALLKSISAIILGDNEVDWSKPTEELKEVIPSTKWLGLAAQLLLSEHDEDRIQATKIISEYSQTNCDDENTIAPTVEQKRQDKFREKYMKAQKEIADLTKLLNAERLLTQKAKSEVEALTRLQDETTALCNELKAEVSRLKEASQLLQFEIERLQSEDAPKPDDIPCPPKTNIKIFAPNCKSFLQGYSDFFDIQFDELTVVAVAAAVEQCDETWAVFDLLPYGTTRALKKLKLTHSEKVYVFNTSDELLAHAERIANNR